MRHRQRPVLITAGLVALALAAGCAVSVDDGSDPDNRDRDVTPSAEAREYCALVKEFYGRLDEFVARTQEQLGPDPDQAEIDQRTVSFIRENQELFEQLAAAAPAEIAADAATQAAAFEQVALQGTVAPLYTREAMAAESRTVDYEQKECGITVE